MSHLNNFISVFFNIGNFFKIFSLFVHLFCIELTVIHYNVMKYNLITYFILLILLYSFIILKLLNKLYYAIIIRFFGHWMYKYLNNVCCLSYNFIDSIKCWKLSLYSLENIKWLFSCYRTTLICLIRPQPMVSVPPNGNKTIYIHPPKCLQLCMKNLNLDRTELGLRD